MIVSPLLRVIVSPFFGREEPMVPDDHDEVDMNDFDPENDRHNQNHR